MECINCRFSWGAEYDYSIEIDDCTGYEPGDLPLVTYCRLKPRHTGLWANEGGYCSALEELTQKVKV